MHPWFVVYFVLFSGFALFVHHGIRVVKCRKEVPGPARHLLRAWIWLLLSAVSVCGYFHCATAHIAFETPIAPASAKENGQEFWLTLPPGRYWSGLVFYHPDGKSSSSLHSGITAFTFKYAVFINEQLVTEGGKYSSAPYGDHAFYDDIVVRSRRDLVRIELNVTPDDAHKELPRMGYIIQTVDELRYFSRGIRISETLQPM